jgi:hypothetical protein
VSYARDHCWLLFRDEPFGGLEVIVLLGWLQVMFMEVDGRLNATSEIPMGVLCIFRTIKESELSCGDAFAISSSYQRLRMDFIDSVRFKYQNRNNEYES